MMNRFHTTLLVLALAGSALFLSACGDKQTLDAGKIKSMLNDQLADKAKAEAFATIQVGYYEEPSDDARYKLRQLAANELITYSVEKIEGTVQSRYWPYQPVPKTFYFVNIALTKKGEKLVCEKLPEAKDDTDKDLENTRRADSYPEDSVDPDEFPAPKTSAERSDNEYQSIQPVRQQPSEPAPKTAYELALEKAHTTPVHLRAAEVRVVKVRDIRIDRTEMTASCEAILEIRNVTPAGRIYLKVYEGERDAESVRLVYYEDKGWVLR